MKKTTITLTLVLILAGMGAPGLAQSLELLTQPQKGKSMRVSSGNPIDNADSEKFEIGQNDRPAGWAGKNHPYLAGAFLHGYPLSPRFGVADLFR